MIDIHPNRTMANLGRVPGCPWHCSILSKERVSKNPGAVQTIAAAVTLAVIALVAGCGSSGTKDATGAATTVITEETTTTTKKPALNQAKVNTALLTLADLPAGYSPRSTDSASSTDDSMFCPDATTALPTAFVTMRDKEGSVGFEQSQLGPILLEILVAGSDAKSAFTNASKALDSCTASSWTKADAKGAVTTYSIAPVSFPKHGDEQAAFRLTATAVGVELDGYVIVMRIGDVLALMMGVGTTSIVGSHPMPVDQFTTIVDTAVKKVDEL